MQIVRDENIFGKYFDVPTKRLNEAVKKNIERFPENFMFQLTKDEWENLRSQITTANPNVSKIHSLPYVLTEYETLMLSNILNSKKAINYLLDITKSSKIGFKTDN